jgi:hypothetical protein
MDRDIEVIIDRVKSRVPGVTVSQLTVKHPGVDDDGLWFFSFPGVSRDIQLESSTGKCPFLVEHSDMKATSEAKTARSIEEAVDEVVAYLSKLLHEM